MAKTQTFRAARLFGAVALMAGTVACTTVGPDYAGAPNAAPQAASRDAFLRGGAAVANAPAARWWEQMHDPLLTQLRDDARRVLDATYPQSNYLTQGIQQRASSWWKPW